MKPILILLMLGSFVWGVDNTKLPSDVVALLSACDKDVTKIKTDAEIAVALRMDKMRPLLIKAQEAATKKGDLDTAMAIKSEVEKLAKPETKAVVANDLKSRLTGTLSYSMTNGHKGRLVIDGENVTDALGGHKGTLEAAGKSYTLTWDNGSAWDLRLINNKMIAISSVDGQTELIPYEKK